MKKNLVSTLVIATSLLVFSSCEKGGGDFSISSDSSQFQQAATFVPRKLDVLFVMDNSGSMSSSQTKLANNFPSFINYFKSKGYDFRLAVTTSDAYYGDQFVNSGCSLCNPQQTQFRSGVTPAIRVIENSTANLESVFSSNIQVGTSGSGDERVFSSFRAALSSSLNVGFHRPDAYLSVILISDEEDFSHDDINFNESYSQPTLHDPAIYKTYLEGFTAGQATKDFSVSTISVLDDACKTSLGTGQKISIRLMQLADLTGGTKNSICNSFATVLDNISASIATQTQAIFKLNRKPTVNSIRVIIDGVLVPQDSTNGWVYDATANTVKIVGSTYQPQSGSSITINFDPSI